MPTINEHYVQGQMHYKGKVDDHVGHIMGPGLETPEMYVVLAQEYDEASQKTTLIFGFATTEDIKNAPNYKEMT